MFNFSKLAGHPGLIWTYALLGIGACLLLLAVLHFLPRDVKRYLVIGLTFIAGLIYAVEYFWPPAPKGDPNPLSNYTDTLGNVLQVVAAFTFLLGIYNLIHIHANAIRRRRPNWSFSLVFFSFSVLMAVAGFWRDGWQWFGPQPSATLTPQSVRNPQRFISDFRNPPNPLLQTLRARLTPPTVALLPFYDNPEAVRAQLQRLSTMPAPPAPPAAPAPAPGAPPTPAAPAPPGGPFTVAEVTGWLEEQKGLAQAWKKKEVPPALVDALAPKVNEKVLGAIVGDLNAAIHDPALYDPAVFGGARLSPETKALLQGAQTGPELVRRNRYLLEEAYPQGLARHLRLADLPPAFILDRNTLDPELRAELGLLPIPPAFDPLYANDLYTYLFQGLFRNLEATMFSILAFYIVSAAYRAFRVRSAEAALMMVTAVILMAGQVPLGMALTNWIPLHGPASGLRIENFSYWVLSVINMPVQRAIDFGLGLGALAMSLRIWLSLERGTYFGQEV
jgi:hypothetical protein